MFDADTITQDVVQRVVRHRQQIERSLAGLSDDATPISERAPSPLHSDISLFVQIANGTHDRALMSDQQVGDVIERFQRLLDLLFMPASGLNAYSIPAAFWHQTSIGQMLAHVQAWLRRDDLIGYTDAAQLLFPELAQTNIQAARMRIKRLTERGELMSYVDPSIANPTQQARVSRQAIEALHASGKLADR